jgi:CRP-like cAMP-binding protein
VAQSGGQSIYPVPEFSANPSPNSSQPETSRQYESHRQLEQRHRDPAESQEGSQAELRTDELRNHDYRALRKVEVLDSLDNEEIERLKERLPTLAVKKNALLFTPGYRANVSFFVLDGAFRIYKQREGWELTLQIFHEGDMFSNGVFGEDPSGAEDELRFATYAQAMKDSRVAMIRHEYFKRLISEHPEVGVKALGISGRRLALYGQRMFELATQGTPERLASLILELVEAEGVVCSKGFYKIPTRYTHEELASMVGCRRVALTRALGTLKDYSVEQRDHRIYVRDLQTLRGSL